MSRASKPTSRAAVSHSFWTEERAGATTPLRQGWASTTLGEVATLSPEKVEPSQTPNAHYIGLEHIESGTRRLVTTGKASDVRSTKNVFHPGQVLYGKLRPYLNKVLRPDFEGVCSTDILVLSPGKAIEAAFLERLLGLPRFVEFAAANSAGINLPRANFTKLAKFAFSLPPLAEQRRIVARLEALEARSRRARAALDEVPALLAQARQSLLAAAFRGDLTKEWRRRHNGEESAGRLLDLVASQRFERWQENRKARGLSADKPDYPAPVPASDGFPPEVPKGWTVASMDALTSAITSGSRDWTRFNRAGASGTFIMAQNVRPRRLDLSERQGVNPPANDRDRERSQVEPGDLLVTIVGANTGDICRVPRELTEHYVCQSVALMRPVLPEMGEFLELYMNSPAHGQWQFKEWMYGQGRPHLSFDHLRQTAVHLPPLAEQREIVRRLETALARLDAAALAHAAAVAELDRLDQSLLARAFRGQLVPQDPNDEPATMLLNRIRREKHEKAPEG